MYTNQLKYLYLYVVVLSSVNLGNFTDMSSFKSCLQKVYFSNTIHSFKNSLCSFHSCNVNNSDQSIHEKSKSFHEYSSIWKYLDVESTSKYLLENVFYHQNGVVAINKPLNLGSSRTEDTIYNCLPYLAKEFGYKYLQLVSVPDKYCSGVTLLSSNEKITKRIEKSLKRSKAIFSRDPKQTFLAVTVGRPSMQENVNQYGVTKRRKDNINYPLVLHDWGANEVKRREVNVGFIRHNVLATSEFASLVSVSTWQMRHHFPRMYLSDVMFSPVLGDNMFGPRVGSVFEKPVLIKPWHAPAVKALPLPLLQALNARSGSETLIPLHFHLHELVLHQFLIDGSHLVLQTEPPNYFQWTLEKLNLSFSESRNCQSKADIFSS